MKHLINVYIWLYAHLIRFYPRTFYATYADEMVAVFRMKLADRASSGWLALCSTFLRELFDLPLSILQEHSRKDREPMRWFQLSGEHKVRRARNLTRAASFVVALLLNWTFIQIWRKPDYEIWSQSIPFVLTLFITNLLLLVAWRWERLGARLILLGALGVGLTVAYSMFVTARVDNIDIPAFLILFIALAWAFPYILFGLLFLNFSRQTPLLSPA
ncbi:MAG: hypothetical protein ABI690_19410 [Chloroflexota bacterium]